MRKKERRKIPVLVLNKRGHNFLKKIKAKSLATAILFQANKTVKIKCLSLYIQLLNFRQIRNGLTFFLHLPFYLHLFSVSFSLYFGVRWAKLFLDSRNIFVVTDDAIMHRKFWLVTIRILVYPSKYVGFSPQNTFVCCQRCFKHILGGTYALYLGVLLLLHFWW